MQKNNKKIKVPFEIDMTKYSLDLTNVKYELKSVGFHIGSFFGGHYYSMCKNPNGKWYDIDDLSVREEKVVDLGAGYVYFYQVV